MKWRRLITYLNVGLFVGSLLLFYASIQLRAPDWLEQKGLLRIRHAFRDADRLVVQVISADPTATHKDHFVWNSVEYPISQVLHLDEPQSQSLLQQLREQWLGGSGASCHNPGYIVEFHKGGSSFFRCSLCIHCCNIEVEAYPFLMTLVGINNKDTLNLSELELLLNELSKSDNKKNQNTPAKADI